MTKNETRLARAVGLLRQARLLCECAGASRAVRRASDAVDAALDALQDSAVPPPRRLTRQEQLEALADRGIDTWEDYRGEK